ncbi:MAG TPA: TerC/Alx family metal homeostasis membrane protein [Jatrophihabitantaceae bacterium]|nr:TerC/Alx family metal homeostasis membrane protein [Jatrophihabitantaceae bacterium]
MHVEPWVWALTLALAVVFLVFDVFYIGRRPHEPSLGESARHFAFFVAGAVLFAVGILVVSGPEYAGQFAGGWLTEYSLSVDNLFVFLLILTKLQVPRHLQQSALLVGIVLALVLRGAFIAAGAAAINAFSWVFYVFGAFLVYTAARLARDDETDPSEYTDGRMVRFFRRRIPSTDEWHGAHVIVRSAGRRVATPMMVVIVALGTTDLLFALDSIPAIYGLTEEPYLVLTANLFALMGLRQLYFLLGGMLQRLVYLNVGLSVLLGFIGVKLILHALHENTLPFVNGGEPVTGAPDLPIWVSLTAIVGILAVTTVASLVKSGHDARRQRSEVS